MRRRRLLQAGAVGAGIALLPGCLGDGSPSTDTPAQSGSGHPCSNPRNIDYDAVDQYQDQGVYLENTDDATHTACVTVTKEDRDREEEGTSSPPPLRRTGYAVDSGMAVEIFTFDEPGRYTIEVRIEEATKTESFERTEEAFTDEETTITTFEITGPSTIEVTRREDS